MNVFLTGGTGFIGQALVRRILARGWALKVLVRNPDADAGRWIARQGASVVRGDVTMPRGLAELMRGSDILIHNAGVYELGADAAESSRMRTVNVGGTENTLNAAHIAGIPRTVYVSSVWALGPSGRPPAASVTKDETQRHDGQYLTVYERSKAESHEIALQWRTKGLPLVTAMPNGVVGTNDHSAFGYFLRLTLNGCMPPIAWGGDAVFAFVEVEALAEGLCLAAENAAMGEDYVFCGPRQSLREVFKLWGRKTGRTTPRWFLPRGFMRPQVALLEPLERALGLTAFMSRDTVDASKAHLDYSSAKAERELGWKHPNVDVMWDRIIRDERTLMAGRKGFLGKLRHQSIAEVTPS